MIKFRQFRTQLMLLAILMVALAVMLTAEFTTKSFLETLWAQDSAAMSAQFALVEEQLLNRLDDANHCMSVVQRRDSVLSFFLKQSNHSTGSAMYANDMLRDVTTAISEMRMVSGILFIQDGRMYGITPYWNFNGASVPDGLNAQLSDLPVAYSINWISTLPLQSFTDVRLTASPHASSRYLTGVSRLRYSTLSYPVDITTLTLISVDDIDAILDQLGAGGGDVALLNGAGHIIAGDYMELSDLSFDRKYGEIDYTESETDYRAFYCTIPSKGWTMVRRMDRDAYQRQAMELRRKSYLTGIIAIAGMIVLYALLSRLFFRPFQQVMGLFRQVRDGNLNARLAPFDRRMLPVADEMQTMRTQLNGMLDSLSELIINTERANRERAEIEIHSLQRQLNPHMIFNTLTSIRWMIMLHGDSWPGSESVDAMIREFAALLQPLFDDMRPEWSLREELEHIGHYIALLRMRYCADFTVVNDAGDAMADFRIPRFILQPVLENSCEHGMAGSQSLKVELRVEVSDGFLRIGISDNGCGIPPEKLDALRAKLSGSETPGDANIGRSGIGLTNVHRQLRTHFGPRSGITIDSSPDCGTHVVLLMEIDGAA